MFIDVDMDTRAFESPLKLIFTDSYLNKNSNIIDLNDVKSPQIKMYLKYIKVLRLRFYASKDLFECWIKSGVKLI